MKIENLNLSSLKYFIDACEAQSLTQSALLNHISRPAVSQAILRLEEWFGRPLLIHARRNFELTAAGQEFYKLGKKIFLEIQTALNDQGRGQSQTVEIGCSFSLLDFIYPQIQNTLQKSENPKIKIEKTSELLKALGNGDIHLAYVVNPPNQNLWLKKTIRTGSFRVFSKSGRMMRTLITTESRPEVSRLKHHLKSKKIPTPQMIQVESWAACFKMSSLGLGACQIPDFISQENLIEVTALGFRFPYEVQIVAKKNQELSELEQELWGD